MSKSEKWPPPEPVHAIARQHELATVRAFIPTPICENDSRVGRF